MLEEEKANIDHLIAHGEEYLKTREKLTKLIVIEKASKVASSLFSSLIIFFIFFFVIVFASVAIAYMVSEYYQNASAGFIAVTLFYLVAGIVLYVNRDQWLKTPIMNGMIKNFLNHENEQ